MGVEVEVVGCDMEPDSDVMVASPSDDLKKKDNLDILHTLFELLKRNLINFEVKN